MEPECSLSCLQESEIGLYPEPDESRPPCYSLEPSDGKEEVNFSTSYATYIAHFIIIGHINSLLIVFCYFILLTSK
jgi:hypothetical protein